MRRTLAGPAGAAVLLAIACGGDNPVTPIAPSTTTQSTTPTVTLSSVTIAPSEVTGSAGAQGTVTLSAAAPSGGTAVALSSDASAAAVPASVTVAAGATLSTFAITTQSVSADTTITVTASAGGVSRTATLRLKAQAPAAPAAQVKLSALTVDPRIFDGGQPTKGTVTLTGAAPQGGTIVTLTASNPRDARLPDTITVAEGSPTGTFTVNTSDVSSDTEILITASAGGDSRSAQIRLLPKHRPPAAGTTGVVTISGKTK